MISSSQITLWNRIRQTSWVILFLILAITVTEFKVLHYVHKDHLSSFAEMAAAIKDGQSGWRVNQSRLLGSYMVNAVIWFTGWNVKKSYVCLTFFLTLLANFISYYLFKKLCNSSKDYALLYCAVFASLFTAIVDDNFLYVFDYLDAIVGLLFAYGVVTNKKIAFFVPIFLVGIVNREQALFIPLWFILNSVDIKEKTLSFKSRWFISGLFLMGLGILYTKLARDLLFVGGKYWMGNDEQHKMVGNFIIPFENLKNIVDAMGSFWICNDSMPQWVLVIIPAIPIYMWYFHKKYIYKNKSITVLVLSQLTAILTFAFVFETRTFTGLIPFLTMIDCASRFQAKVISE